MCINVTKIIEDDLGNTTVKTYTIDPDMGRCHLSTTKQNDFAFCPKCLKSQRGTINSLCSVETFHCSRCQNVWATKNGQPIASEVIIKQDAPRVYLFTPRFNTFTGKILDAIQITTKIRLPSKKAIYKNRLGEVVKTTTSLFYNPSS